jgi:UDP-GlcNAc:undecaprenyl-phosphate/decaprenyl-phosphate GlcNAc-1-phosphate transferase
MKLIGMYFLLFIIMMIAALCYFKIAGYFNIIDKPNERSSHTVPTIRGGGIIFLLSTTLFFLWNGYSYPYFFTAILLSGIVSFIDDIKTLNNSLKFSIHVLSILLILKECGLLHTLPVLYLVVIGIFFIGVINAYNFMDGINGITGLYSLAVIFPLFLTETDYKLKSLQIFSLIGLLVFNFFNTRKNAKCFSGDVGSISLAILIVFLLMMRIKQTEHYVYIGLLLIYGIDTVFTIIQRLYKKENIFKPHRKHLFQYLSNEKKIPHIQVSIFYALLQLFISLCIVYGYLTFFYLVIVAVLLSIVYWIFKIPFIKISVS